MPEGSPPPVVPPSADAAEVGVHLFYLGKPESEARANLIRRAPPMRMRRAILGLAACWGLAIAAIFLPVLHFILVPALLLAGPLVARSRWLERATVLDVRGPCPGCDQPIEVTLNRSASVEMPLRCPACGRPLTLRIAAAVLDNPADSNRSPAHA